MEELIRRQAELGLIGSLNRYGLNPYDWTLKLNDFPDDIHSIHHIVVKNKSDSTFKFHGLAHIKRLGSAIRTQWLKLMLIDTENS